MLNAKIKNYNRILRAIVPFVFILSGIMLFGATSADTLSVIKLHNVQKDLIVKTLKELKAKQQLTDKEEQKLEIYSIAQSYIEKAKIEQARLDSVLEKAKKAPHEIKNLQLLLKNFKPIKAESLLSSYKNQTLDDLELILKGTQDKLNKLQKKLASLNQQITRERVLPEANRKQVALNQQQLLDLKKKSTSLKPDNTMPFSEQKLLQFSAEIKYLENHNELLLAEINNNGLILELLSKEQQLVVKQIKNAEIDNEELQNTINHKRKIASQALVKNIEKGSEGIYQHKLLKVYANYNIELSQKLLMVTDKISQLTQVSQMVREQLNNLTAIRQDIENQSSLLGDGVLLARALRENLMHLPNIATNKQLLDLLTKSRLEKFKFDQKKQQLADPSRFLIAEEGSQKFTSTEKEEAIQLLRNREKILDSLSTNLGKLIKFGIDLQLEQQRLYLLSKDLTGTLKQRLFWVNSSPPFNIQFLVELPIKLWKEISEIPWLKSMRKASTIFITHWPWIAITLMLSALLLERRKILLKWQIAISENIGRIKQDSLWLTPWSLVLSLLYVSPVALFIVVIAFLLLVFASTPLTAIGYSLIYTSIVFVMFSFISHLLRSGGLAKTHFHWADHYCQKLRIQWRKLGQIVVPMTLLVVTVEKQNYELDQDVLGMMLLMIGALIQSFFMFSLLKQMKNILGSKIAHTLMLLLLPCLSLVQAILIVLGYYYTALILEYQILGTLTLVAGFMLLQAVAIRSINIGEHRLAYQRAVKKYTATDSKPFEEPVLDLATVNQQTLRLLNALLMVGFAILFYWVWKNFSGALSVINTWALWSYSSDNTLNYIYLSNVLIAIITLATTFIFSRNLPGLLEITVLSRLKLPTGNSYATMTLLRYTITSLGIILTLAGLGFTWEKLQWLIAAVGLGLSIGLKEVFANILSGLIILFERPIRIGDTISLGDQIGEVSRIRIRATTIVDWDNREIIIPNAVLLNEKLVNWSLSNSVIRITLAFYVAHDSDTDTVERLLIQACKEHPLIADQPKSIATLMEYGDSALFYELRIFIKHVKYRLRVRNEVNQTVTELFEDNGIKIAPQKRMLYLGNTSESE